MILTYKIRKMRLFNLVLKRIIFKFHNSDKLSIEYNIVLDLYIVIYIIYFNKYFYINEN